MMLFVLERPKTDWGTGRNAGRLKPRAPAWPLKRPDSTKLVRAVEDALTGILWSDDSVIVLGPIAAKRYRMAFEPTPGVHVHAWDVLDYPQPMLTAWEVGR
jgi:Holliday junction resolvase RusA-like endonuclease